MLKSRLAALAAGATVLAVSAAPSVASVAQTPLQATTVSATSTVSARHLLNLLTVAGESHASTYVRSKFTLWVDANHDGENTRAEVLKAESTKTATVNSNDTVVSGRWVSPYDGTVVTLASKLDIDHLVPLHEAWTSGAAAWSAQRRTAYANDTGYSGSLIAVTAHANRSKGDQEPGQWLPSRPSAVCKYVKQYIAVKYRWKLAVDMSEKTDLSGELSTYCASSPSITNPGRPTATQVKALAGVRTTSGGSGGTSGGTDPDYGTCANAKAHDAHTPYYRGTDPEYAYYRDADGDGVVCE